MYMYVHWHELKYARSASIYRYLWVDWWLLRVYTWSAPVVNTTALRAEPEGGRVDAVSTAEGKVQVGGLGDCRFYRCSKLIRITVYSFYVLTPVRKCTTTASGQFLALLIQRYAETVSLHRQDV